MWVVVEKSAEVERERGGRKVGEGGERERRRDRRWQEGGGAGGVGGARERDRGVQGCRHTVSVKGRKEV